MILKRTAGLVLATGLMATAAAPALGQSADQMEILEFQLELARSFAEMEDLVIAAGPFYGYADSGASQSFLLPVHEDREYTIVGVCDGDCDDLDLRIYNSSGALLAEDVLEDALPGVNLTPDMDGEVTVEIDMVSCSNEPCFFAVEAYQSY